MTDLSADQLAEQIERTLRGTLGTHEAVLLSLDYLAALVRRANTADEANARMIRAHAYVARHEELTEAAETLLREWDADGTFVGYSVEALRIVLREPLATIPRAEARADEYRDALKKIMGEFGAVGDATTTDVAWTHWNRAASIARAVLSRGDEDG